MAVSVKELKKRPERLAPGHRACAGCTAPTALRHAMKMTDKNLVCAISTGCMEVSTSIYPFTSWNVSMIHSAFENSAATISGVQAAYEKLHADGKIKEEFKFIGFGGDGGTYDIGFQSLSGAMERGHDMLYVCYDNQAYMNTGIQRSSATPFGAHTNTSQAGSVKQGKEQHRKDLTAIMAHHNLPYVGQAAIHNLNDFRKKLEKGLETKGACFINVLAPCHRGWRIPIDGGLDSSKLAVDTCFWPLYEVEDGNWKLNYKPKEKLPIVEWLKPQGRFKHLFKPENAGMLEEIQAYVDRKWDEILVRCGEK
ncbi:MAG: thiamine pyrophosphate-dependent enzyme [Planctomycetota bacterium]|jgi:pyruvate ferredoxin oxidoreductase beta subunit